MPLDQVCDIAHLILVEKADAMVQAELTAALTNGAEEYAGPDYEAARQRVDDMLAAPFVRVRAGAASVADAELRKAVGVS